MNASISAMIERQRRRQLPSSFHQKRPCSFKICFGGGVLILIFFFVRLQYNVLRSTNGNYALSTTPKHRRPKILFVHIGKTGGEFIKAQLAVICKTRKNKLVKADCLKRFQSSGKQSLLSSYTMGYLHVHNPVFPKNGLQASTHYLFSVRHPLSRFLSWCKYSGFYEGVERVNMILLLSVSHPNINHHLQTPTIIPEVAIPGNPTVPRARRMSGRLSSLGKIASLPWINSLTRYNHYRAINH